jgi:isovaleryl-CoA dehydrogenase
MSFAISSTVDGENVQLLISTVRNFVEKEITPQVKKIEELGSIPRTIWQALGSLGLLGITVPEEYGGVGLGYYAHCLVMEEISRVSASLGLSYGAHSNLCVNQIMLNGSDAQRAKYLPKLVAGDYIGALAMSESSSGSDVVSMKLKAERRGNSYFLNGSKMWITNGPQADIIVVYAKTNPSLGSRGITAFIIERNFSGFKSAQKLDKLGMRGSETSELIFDSCEVPAENVLGDEGEGVRVLMSGLDYERIVLSGGPVGIMQACLDTVLPYVRTREQFGKRIGDFQLVQGKLADMYTALGSSRAYLHHVAKLCDMGKVAKEDAAAVILYCAESATKVALDAIQLLGGNGYTSDYPTGRYLRDAKLYEIGAGTSEIRRMLIGRTLVDR